MSYNPYSSLLIRPLALCDVSKVDTSVRIRLPSKKNPNFELTMPYPMGLAPSAFQCMAHPDGEKAVARAAGRTETVMVCSTMSTFSMEDIARSAPKGTVLWFQVTSETN